MDNQNYKTPSCEKGSGIESAPIMDRPVLYMEEIKITLPPGANIPRKLTEIWEWVMTQEGRKVQVIVRAANGVNVTFETKA